MYHTQFAVIGLGRFGTYLARELTQLGHEVLAVDKDIDKVEDVMNDVTHAVNADAADEDALRALGVGNMDVAVVAVGNNIQASILIAMTLKEMGVAKVIAKASSDVHERLLRKVGADRIVFPERDMGKRVAHLISSTQLLDFIEISKDVSIVETLPLPAWEGKTLRQLGLRAKYNLNVIAIRRNGSLKLAVEGDDEIRPDDVLLIVGDLGMLEGLQSR